jgi:hypothetical protein
MNAATFSVWTKDSLNGWNKGAALYADRGFAGSVAVSCVGKMHYQGGAYSGVKAALVYPSHLSRPEVMERIATIGA